MTKKDIMQYDTWDFLEKHTEETSKHIGKWILIFENQIVSSDVDLIKIYNQFRKDNPKSTPFVMKIPESPNMLL